MPSGSIVCVTDRGAMRVEASVERRGVEPVVCLRVFDIAAEEFHTRNSGPAQSLAAARAAALETELDIDQHEWATFLQFATHVNMRVHREREQIAIEHGWVQNQTEQPARAPRRGPVIATIHTQAVDILVSPEEDADIRGVA